MSANLCSGVYFIRHADSGLVVHVTGCNLNLVGSAQDYDQAGAQLFKFERWHGAFIITNISTKLVIDMEGGSSAPGTRVLSCNNHGGTNQQWFIRREGDENSMYHLITNVKTGTVMDLDGSKLESCAEIFGYKAHHETYQQWEFIGLTEHMLGKQIQLPGSERVVEKIIPGPERVVEKVVERVVPGPERVVEKIVVNFHDSPDTLRELRELKAQILRAMEGWGQTLPKVDVSKTAGDHQSGVSSGSSQ